MLEALIAWQKKHNITMSAWADLSEIIATTAVQPFVPADQDDRGETPTTAIIRLEASKVGVSLWRNNSGVATNRDGRPVRFGLGNDSKRINETMKSSDLIGMSSRGQFVAVEVKRPGWGRPMKPFTAREQAQWNFHEHVRRNGGIAGFATCVADLQTLFAGRI